MSSPAPWPSSAGRAGVAWRLARRIALGVASRLPTSAWDYFGSGSGGTVTAVVVVEAADRGVLLASLRSLAGQQPQGPARAAGAGGAQTRSSAGLPRPAVRVAGTAVPGGEAANAGAGRDEGETILPPRGRDSPSRGSVAAMARALAESGGRSRVRLGVAHRPAGPHLGARPDPSTDPRTNRPGCTRWRRPRARRSGDPPRLVSRSAQSSGPTTAGCSALALVAAYVPAVPSSEPGPHGRVPLRPRPWPAALRCPTEALTHLAAWRRRSSLSPTPWPAAPLAKDWAASEVGLALPRLLLATERATEAEWAQADRPASAASPAADATPVDARALVWLAAQAAALDVETSSRRASLSSAVSPHRAGAGP
ncbi:MAG: hypothetical protein R2734_03795 [Nocardioides sp.]